MLGAVIGLGNVALKNHLPIWRERNDLQIVAGVDSLAGTYSELKKILPEVKAFSNLDECLSSTKIDFVDITTPSYTHFVMAKSALNAGCHVLCESPLVLNHKDIMELDIIARESGKALVTVHNWKYSPLCKKLSELLAEGVIGHIKHMDWYVIRPGPEFSILPDEDDWHSNPALSGGGVLVEHGWSTFYLLQEWLNGQAEKISVNLENRQYEDLGVEDTAKVHLEYLSEAGPTMVEIFLTWASRLSKNSGLIEGTEGRIHIEDDLLIVETNSSPREIISFKTALSKSSNDPVWFQSVIDEFSQEISNPQHRGINFKSAKECLKLIEKSKESNKKNGMELSLKD